MRAGFPSTWLMIAVVAGGCGSSTVAAADASTDGAPFCAQALRVDCSVSSSQARYCSLSMGSQTACSLCPPPDAGQGCDQIVLVHGTKYTYLQLLGVDTATVYVYDATDALVAQLGWHPGGWTCEAGPPDFDPSEAESQLPVVLSSTLNGMCPIDAASAR